MSSDSFAEAATVPAGAANALLAGDYRGTWEDLPPVALPPAAAVLTTEHVVAAAAVWEHVRTQAELLIATPERVDSTEAEALRQDGFALVSGDRVEPALVRRSAVGGRVWLLTSGSTGRPKRVAHSLQSLTTVGAAQPPRRWLCPYSPGTYAWWQLVTLSLAQPGQEVVFVEPAQRDDWPDLALAQGVTAASGTPTFWRHALWHAGDTVAKLPLQQVTLGGEPVDQAVLDRLAAVFPQARVSWIYASSEAGATIAVHDGRAGFPIEWLERDEPGRPRLSVVDHELLIDSPWHAQGMGGALPTGDRVEILDGRVLITARMATDEINVGGAKASAAGVRQVLLSHPAVAWARVTGRRAPLVGRIVSAEVVASAPVTEQELTSWCAQRLPDHAVPRRLRFLDEMPMKETLKSDV